MTGRKPQAMTHKDKLKDLLKTQLKQAENRLTKAQDLISQAMQETITGITEAREAQKEVEIRFKEQER